MYQFHFWVALRDAGRLDEFGDYENNLLPRTLEALHALTGDGPLDPQIVCRNGQWTLFLNGFSNRLRPHVREAFRTAGRIAPGSFGYLLDRDDEAVPPEDMVWKRHVMVRGSVEVDDDPSFTPHAPTLEDD